MPRIYEEVIQRIGVSMYHRYMSGRSPNGALDNVEIVSFIYDVPVDEIRAAAYEVYEAHWPLKEEPA